MIKSPKSLACGVALFIAADTYRLVSGFKSTLAMVVSTALGCQAAYEMGCFLNGKTMHIKYSSLPNDGEHKTKRIFWSYFYGVALGAGHTVALCALELDGDEAVVNAVRSVLV
jgi:hypothetical protein